LFDRSFKNTAKIAWDYLTGDENAIDVGIQ